MGVGHLSIGTGIGDASVFNVNPAIQQYGQMLQQRKAKEDADRQFLANQLATVKPDGLRNDADRTQFYNKYNSVKNDAINAEQIRNPMQKAMAIANVRQSLLDLNNYAAESKQQAAKENEFSKAYMANPTGFSDNAINTYRKSITLPINHPDTVTDFTTLARNVDGNKIEQQQALREKALLGNTKWDEPTLKNMTVAGKKGTFIMNGRTVPKEQLYEDALHRATADNNFDHFLQQQYPQAYQGVDPVSGRANAVKTYIDSRPAVSEYKEPQEKQAANPDKFYEHYAYRMAHPLGTGANGMQTPAQTLIVGDPNQQGTGMQGGDGVAINKFLQLAPTAQYKGGGKPTFTVDPQSGEHIFSFPAQGAIDQKAVKNIETAKEAYNNSGKSKDSFFGLSKGTPWEESKQYKAVVAANPIFKEKMPAQVYRVPPTSPDYASKLSQIAADQGINLSKLNQIESVKGGHGQIPQVQAKPGVNPVNKHKKAATDYGL